MAGRRVEGEPVSMRGSWVPGRSSVLHTPPPLHERKAIRPIFQLRLGEGEPLV